MIPDQLRWFLRMTRPVYLLAGVLLYALGAGIARYLGFPIGLDKYLLGQVWVILLQLSLHFLVDYFDLRPGMDNPSRNPFSNGSGALGVERLPRATALWSALGTFTVSASLTVLLIQRGEVVPSTLLIMIFMLAGALLYAVPPARLLESGYGELILSIWITNLVPAFAFLLQTGQYHRLLAMSTFPLTALHLVMIMAYQFVDFARDVKFENRTLTVRMGWRNAMTLHNLLILSAFLLLGLAALYGLPGVISLPPFVLLPLGLLEIWQMTRIRSGARPNWRALTLNAIALFGMMAYLLTFSFWTR